MDHLLKGDFPDVATKMHFYCTNLQEIMQTESGNVVSKATKVSIENYNTLQAHVFCLPVVDSRFFSLFHARHVIINRFIA